VRSLPSGFLEHDAVELEALRGARPSASGTASGQLVERRLVGARQLGKQPGLRRNQRRSPFGAPLARRHRGLAETAASSLSLLAAANLHEARRLVPVALRDRRRDVGRDARQQRQRLLHQLAAARG
jgi:hypothetical protein